MLVARRLVALAALMGPLLVPALVGGSDHPEHGAPGRMPPVAAPFGTYASDLPLEAAPSFESPGHGPHVVVPRGDRAAQAAAVVRRRARPARHAADPRRARPPRPEGDLLRHRLAAQGGAARGRRAARSGPQDRRARPPGRQPHDEPPRPLPEPGRAGRGDRRQRRAHHRDDGRASVSLPLAVRRLLPQPGGGAGRRAGWPTSAGTSTRRTGRSSATRRRWSAT